MSAFLNRSRLACCSISALVVCTAAPAMTAAQEMPWTVLDTMPVDVVNAEPWIRPDAYAPLALDLNAMRDLLSDAPMENLQAPVAGKMILLPMPDGSLSSFNIWESPMMEQGLADQFPEIHTFVGQGIDDPSAALRLDVTMHGFHAQVLSPNGDVYIDPFSKGNATHYSSYFTKDTPETHDWQCFAHGEEFEAEPLPPAPELVAVTLRTYRAAIAATGEYTQFHGGTVSAGQSAIVTAVNRVNGVLERDVAARLELVANNTSIVFTNPSTDPYSSNDPFTLLNQNPGVLNSNIGFSNYDIGHVFGRGGGGVAYLQSVCTNNKAGASSGSFSPVGDGFVINIVAHEIGHQFGAAHSFNGVVSSCGPNRSPSSAYEPGSGSTIMSYAGICGSDNIQFGASAYYHSRSLDQIRAHIFGPANACAQKTTTTNETPTVTFVPARAIPTQTPFELVTTASDPTGGALTYCWEERDLGPAQPMTGASSQDNGSSPIFRSFNPTSNPLRTFPKTSSLINNTTTIGEQLPSLARVLKMRLTVRDNFPGAGGLGLTQTNLTVVDTGVPFVVISPNVTTTLSGQIPVAWFVANTDVAPISTPLVDILLSTNGGNSFTTVLAQGVPNDGNHTVTLPNITTNSARIKVKGTDNYFFDISNKNFIIEPASCYPDCDGSGALNILDYICFGDAFAAGNTYADCDNSGGLNILDYICYGDAFAAGCP